VSTPSSFSIPDVLGQLLAGRDLSASQTERLITEVLAGRIGDAPTAGLLVALRAKGETGEELAAAAGVLRRHMVPLETARVDLLDTCGTGGDATNTFNISTATALVVAATGVPVVKHGNRAASSRSGSADVLAALGVTVECDAATVLRCLEIAGLAFCHAPRFHPVLRQVAALRRQLGVRTLFNFLGPLLNPAGASFQLIGVGQAGLLDPLAEAVKRLGTRHTLVVAGRDGLDEVTLTDVTLVRRVRGDAVTALEWTPEEFGLQRCRLEDLQVDSPAASAAAIRDVLNGVAGPRANVVLANAAASLLAAGRAGTLVEGVRIATAAVADGRARRLLDRLVAASGGESAA
jgi:anthranilate phosphoribosyltransferase